MIDSGTPRHASTYVIVSSYRHLDALAFLSKRKLGGLPAYGKYKGRPEHSIIVNLRAFVELHCAGFLHGQESVLVLGAANEQNERPAALHYLDNRPTQSLGMYRQTTDKEAFAADAWTRVGGRYYVAS